MHTHTLEMDFKISNKHDLKDFFKYCNELEIDNNPVYLQFIQCNSNNTFARPDLINFLKSNNLLYKSQMCDMLTLISHNKE